MERVVCCKCGHTGQKFTCAKCEHKICSSCPDPPPRLRFKASPPLVKRYCKNCGDSIYYSRVYKVWFHTLTLARPCSLSGAGVAESRGRDPKEKAA